eukprot:2100243-Prymnesium_polylepis.1
MCANRSSNERPKMRARHTRAHKHYKFEHRYKCSHHVALANNVCSPVEVRWRVTQRFRAKSAKVSRRAGAAHGRGPGSRGGCLQPGPVAGLWHAAYSLFSQRQAMASRGPRSGPWLCALRGRQLRGCRAVIGMETSGLHADIDSPLAWASRP